MKTFMVAMASVFALSFPPGSFAQDKGTPGGLMRASKAIGMNVKSPSNESLGDVQDLLLDQDSGSIAYAVLSFGGFLGLGDKLFAVPWSALKPTPDRKEFTLAVAKEQLEKAPGFDKKNWPDVNNRTWGVEIHKFYGVQPYWEVRGGAVVPSAPVAPPKDPPLRVHTGKVKTFERLETAVVVVETESGEITAELAPPSFLEQQVVVFAPGDVVTIRGGEIVRDGRKIFLVSEATTKDRRTIRLRQDDLTPVWTPVVKKDGKESVK